MSLLQCSASFSELRSPGGQGWLPQELLGVLQSLGWWWILWAQDGPTCPSSTPVQSRGLEWSGKRSHVWTTPPPGSVSMEFHLSKTSACHRGMQSARLVTDGDINEKHQLITEHILPRNISVLDLVTGTLHLCAKRSDMSQPCSQTWTPTMHLW